jgi:hypothetical protein
MEKKIINLHFWSHNREMVEAIEYDPQTDYPYSDELVSEIVLHVLSKGYHVQTRGTGESLIICIDNKNFTTR